MASWLMDYRNLYHYRRVLGVNYIKDLKAIVGRGGAITFAPPPGYTLEKVRYPRSREISLYVNGSTL